MLGGAMTEGSSSDVIQSPSLCSKDRVIWLLGELNLSVDPALKNSDSKCLMKCLVTKMWLGRTTEGNVSVPLASS
jgi:hypothetical protein